MSSERLEKYYQIYKGIIKAPASSDPEVQAIISKYDLAIKTVLLQMSNFEALNQGDSVDYPQDWDSECQGLLDNLMNDLAFTIGNREKDSPTEADHPLLEKPEIINRLRADYQFCVDTMFSLSQYPNPHPNNKLLYRCQSIANPLYRGEYEPTATVPLSREYVVPSFDRIEAAITPEIVAIYKTMIWKGLKPRLSLVPLGLSPYTMFVLLNNHIRDKWSTYPDVRPSDEFSQAVRQGNLKYIRNVSAFVQSALVTGTSVGTMTKHEYIEEGNGWLVQFAAMEPFLPEAKKAAVSSNDNRERFLQSAKYYSEELGLSGMTWEGFLMAQIYHVQAQNKEKGLLDSARRGASGKMEDWSTILGGHLRVEGQQVEIALGSGLLTHRQPTLYFARDKTTTPYLTYRPCFNIPLINKSTHPL